jgi:UDP-N-acetylmuramoyl-tripeptide--D-alanyl-D-alanine ligase
MEISDLYKLYCDAGFQVSTDSRSIPAGAVFFALRGENFDGNDYALKALEAGASYAVVNDDIAVEDPRFIPVADPFSALQQLAVWHRTHLDIRVIGLTGTNGKTTTKELISAALGAKFKVSATKGNLNNDIGVPLTLLSISPDTEIAVVEMGANHPDDIAKLVKVSQPDYGFITNVGTAHLLGFGSYEGVLAAKTELYKWLGSRRGSLIFVNTDYPDLAAAARIQPCHQWEFSAGSMKAELLPTSESDPFLSLKLGTDEVHTKLVGSYNLPNVLAAIAIADFFGVDRKASIAAVEAYTPSNQRSQLVRTETNTLIVDAYNANPSSMRLAIENLLSIKATRKLALLGDMRELGASSVKEHVAIVKLIKENSLPAFLVGDEFAKALEECGTAPGTDSCILGCFDSSDALADYLAANPPKAATILVKGSRGIRMEKVIPVL